MGMQSEVDGRPLSEKSSTRSTDFLLDKKFHEGNMVSECGIAFTPENRSR
jgi:hypothetical protein